MIQPEIDHAREAFAFVELLESLSTTDEIMDQLAKALGRFGFESFVLAGLPSTDPQAEPMALTANWPKEWIDIYVRENYFAVDPVLRWCRYSLDPFEWREAPYDRTAEPRAREMMARAAEFRLANGFCIPFYGPSGYHAHLSMAGVDLDLSPRTHPAVRLMGTHAFERIRRQFGPAQRPSFEQLTEREREVLTWTALGKTSAEVADILKLSKRTVDEYSVRASRKLRTQNKTHAVARALQERLISP